jgi:ABC-type transport system substrate-binding protein
LRSLAWVVVLAGARPVAGESRPGYGGTVSAALLSAPVQLDPASAAGHAESSVLGLVLDTLYRFDDHGQPVPHLAAALPVTSSDGLVARVPLRDAVRFHDGTLLSADAVRQSLERLRRGETAWLLAPVRKLAARGGELEFSLHRAAPELAMLLAAPPAAIVRGSAVSGASAVIGTGPFALRRRGDASVVLAAFDGHFAGRPYVDALLLHWHARPSDEVRRYEAGHSHVSFRGAAAFAGHVPKYVGRRVEAEAVVLVYVGFGQRAAVQSRALRAALSLAINRDGLRHLGSGERVVGAVLPELGAAPARSALRPDPARARTALASAARATPAVAALLAGGGGTLEVLVDASRLDDAAVAEKVVAALFQLGLAARAVLEPAARFAERVRGGDCDLYIGQLVAPGPSTALLYAAAFARGRDDWAAAALARAPIEPARAAAAFAERWPLVPLFFRGLQAHHRGDLRGLRFDLAARPGFADVFFFGQPELSGRAPAAGR